jgi:hypothetical protein
VLQNPLGIAWHVHVTDLVTDLMRRAVSRSPARRRREALIGRRPRAWSRLSA